MKLKDICNIADFNIFIKESESCNFYEYNEYDKNDMVFDEDIKSIILLDSEIYIKY